MDTIFEDIKNFYDSVRDSVLQFGSDEIVAKCTEIDDLIEKCSSYTLRDESIPRKLLVQLINLFNIFIALYKLWKENDDSF